MFGAEQQQVIFPISELSSYHTRWTIKARVTNKSPLRTFNRSGAEGKVFHVEILDAEGGEIRASFFNNAATQFFDRLIVGKCFLFSRGSCKVANRQYNPCNHRYELVFDKDATVEQAADDEKIECVKFAFVNLRSVQTKQLPCRIDCLGVVTAFKPYMNLNGKDGKEFVKRELTIADDSGVSMEVTLWGEEAKMDDKKFEGQPIIALKGVAIKEWNGGRTGSLLASGQCVLQPTMPEAKKVEEWWKQGGATQALTVLSNGGGGGGAAARNAVHMSLGDMRRAAERVLDTVQHYSIVARLAVVQTTKQGEFQPLYYSACAETKEGSSWPCNKRVDAGGYCPACNRAGKVNQRLNARCRFTDFEDSAWLTTFHEPAQQVLGMTGEELRQLEEGKSDRSEAREAVEAAIRKRCFSMPFQLTVRAKMDSYNGEERTNVTCVDARPLDRAAHGRHLLGQIQEMLTAAPLTA